MATNVNYTISYNTYINALYLREIFFLISHHKLGVNLSIKTQYWDMTGNSLKKTTTLKMQDVLCQAVTKMSFAFKIVDFMVRSLSPPLWLFPWHACLVTIFLEDQVSREQYHICLCICVCVYTCVFICIWHLFLYLVIGMVGRIFDHVPQQKIPGKLVYESFDFILTTLEN